MERLSLVAIELVIAAIVAALVIIAGATFVVTRKRAGLDEPPAKQEVTNAPVDESSPATRTVVDRPDINETPTAEADGVTAAPEFDFQRPDPADGRLVRLRSRLSRSQTSIGKGLLSLLSRERIDEDTWEEIEDTLLTADLGVEPTQELVERLRKHVRVEGIADPERARQLLRYELIKLVDPSMKRSLATDRHVEDGRPAVVVVVGVNGAGKTTAVGKLARVLVAEDREVILGAADTFRAAAADQLETWGNRVGVLTVRGPEGGDPASVAFDAVKTGTEQEADTVIVDTAGRLQTKKGLMDELGKVKRVIEKHGPVDEVLLVIDATTGQNGMQQARVFAEVVDVTGIILTKLDGTAKGGIVVAVQRNLGVPVKLVGLGEGPDDLAPFDAAEFVDGLLA